MRRNTIATTRTNGVTHKLRLLVDARMVDRAAMMVQHSTWRDAINSVAMGTRRADRQQEALEIWKRIMEVKGPVKLERLLAASERENAAFQEVTKWTKSQEVQYLSRPFEKREGG